MSQLNDIKDAIKARIVTINGAGGYTYNLSTTGRVVVASGLPMTAPDTSVWLVQGPVESSVRGLGAGTLAKWNWTVPYAVLGWVSGAGSTPEDQIEAANLLYADLWTALMADRRLGGLVVDTTMSGMDALEGAAFGFAGLGVCVFGLTIIYEGSTP